MNVNENFVIGRKLRATSSNFFIIYILINQQIGREKFKSTLLLMLWKEPLFLIFFVCLFVFVFERNVLRMYFNE